MLNLLITEPASQLIELLSLKKMAFFAGFIMSLWNIFCKGVFPKKILLEWDSNNQSFDHEASMFTQ